MPPHSTGTRKTKKINVMEQGLTSVEQTQMSHWRYKSTQTHTNTTFQQLMRREVRVLLWAVDGETL